MRVVWFTGVAALSIFVGMAWYLAPLRPGPLALQLTFSPAAFAAVIHSWSPGDLERYRAHLPCDFVLLVCYGVFGWSLVSRTRLFQGVPKWLREIVRWMLPLAALFDAVEDLLHGWLTAMPRFGVVLPYVVSGSCSVLKWILLIGFAVAAALALARAEDR